MRVCMCVLGLNSSRTCADVCGRVRAVCGRDANILRSFLFRKEKRKPFKQTYRHITDLVVLVVPVVVVGVGVGELALVLLVVLVLLVLLVVLVVY